MFDRSVQPLTGLMNTEPPLTSVPSIAGSGQWVHPTVYEFTPEANALIGGTTYTLALDPDLAAVAADE